MKDQHEYLLHVRDECVYLLEKAQGLDREDFIEDETLKRSFVRSLEVIGEASKNVSDDLKQRHPDLNWKEMAGMRDVLIHGYFSVNYNIVWDVVINHIPPLLEQVNAILGTGE